MRWLSWRLAAAVLVASTSLPFGAALLGEENAKTAAAESGKVRRIGVRPPNRASSGDLAAPAPIGPATGNGLVVYRGGPLMQAVRVYTIFWVPSGRTVSTPYKSLVNRFLTDVGGSKYFRILQQYAVGNSLSLGGTWVDTAPYPNSFSFDFLYDHDIQNEITRAISINGWPNGGFNSLFIVLTASGVESCADDQLSICTPNITNAIGKPYCAYHTEFGPTSQPIIYANMPYQATWPSCASLGTTPNDLAADATIDATSHEMFEAITDPVFNGWFDATGTETGEIADKCTDFYGTRDTDGSNLTLNYNKYVVQLEWSNRDGCALAYGPPLPPTNDFDGNGRSDIAVYRPSSGTWFISGQAGAVWGAPGDIPVPGDYDGDGRSDAAVYRPSTHTWYVRGRSAASVGQVGWIPVPGDYDGDGKTDMAAYDPGTGRWEVAPVNGTFNPLITILGGTGQIPVPGNYLGRGRTEPATFIRGTWTILGQSPIAWGTTGDIPVPADYDGDGVTDIAVYRPRTGTWYVRNQFAISWGAPGDVPVAFDVDGDGRAELLVYRPSIGTWFVYNPRTGSTSGLPFGALGDFPAMTSAALRFPVAGDVDGDRIADLTVFRPSSGVWYSFLSASAPKAVAWGASSDVPVAGDYLGLRRNQPAVFRNGIWFINGGPTITWGTTGDIPVPGDYDGDGLDDLAVFRAGTWYILYSSSRYTTSGSISWGQAGDIPVVADFDGDGRVDPTVFRGGVWYTISSATGAAQSPVSLGNIGDVPVPADFDGDRKADWAVYRPYDGNWTVKVSALTYTMTTLFGGATGDVPVPGDYDGDGFADIAIFRPSTGTWLVQGKLTQQWGTNGDIAILPNR